MCAEIVTRFAPSPTGILHIGGARTALFNWLYARGRGGRFLLRIEDTDHARSTPEARAAILDGLRWLGLDWDGDPVSQSENAPRHAEVAREMLESGAAYRCYATQGEIEAAREAARAAGRSTIYRSPWRDAYPASRPDAPWVVRVKAPREGHTVIADAVQGDVRIANDQLDDMVILRSDGTPTYMLAVVADDHDMRVSHIIRGDDHLNNAARQMLIYRAMGWPVPVWAHIPLIHGEDGRKLSKRNGATGTMEYAAMGYPAPAMRNYLARLGWGHGDDEIFDDTQAQAWFDLDAIGRAPARLDMAKLGHVSGRHIADASDAALPHWVADWRHAAGLPAFDGAAVLALARAGAAVRQGVKTLPELIEKAHFALSSRPLEPDAKAAKALDSVARTMLSDLTPHLHQANWDRDALEAATTAFAQGAGVGLGKIAQPLRAALAGRTTSPSVFDMMTVLGRDETLGRIADAVGA
jgi:glutamyl-tRNA synthetase